MNLAADASVNGPRGSITNCSTIHQIYQVRGRVAGDCAVLERPGDAAEARDPMHV